MIDEKMAEKSEYYMCEFFKRLSKEEVKSIGLMGGWAVHLLLHELDKAHIGSRDIDIFFDPEKIDPGTISGKLREIGFLPHSTFRWVKYFNRPTGKEVSIEGSKKIPSYDLIPIYFDISAPAEITHSMHMPELRKVLDCENKIVMWKGIEIMVPTIKAMIEMKLKSSVERADSFKRAKDLVDLYALSEHERSIWETKEGEPIQLKEIDRKIVDKFKNELKVFGLDGSLSGAVAMLSGVSMNRVIYVFEKM